MVFLGTLMSLRYMHSAVLMLSTAALVEILLQILMQ